MTPPFSLALFSTDPEMIQRCVTAGVSAIVVSWERIDKEERQRGFDTDLSFDTLDDLARVRACTRATVICRVNNSPEWMAQEIEAAVTFGADEILLPMVRSPGEVSAVLDCIAGRCGLGLMVETLGAVGAANGLARLPLTRAYVGLNDLAIECGSANLFEAVANRTVERVAAAFRHIPFGFGGLTLPDHGYPIPCRLLIAEMARIGCSFSFLRRSFHRDITGREPEREIPCLLTAVDAAGQRSPAEVARDWRELAAAIRAWPVPSTPEASPEP